MKRDASVSRARLVALLLRRRSEGVATAPELVVPLAAAIAVHGSPVVKEAWYGAVLRVGKPKESVHSRNKLSIRHEIEIGKLVLGCQPPKGSHSV